MTRLKHLVIFFYSEWFMIDNCLYCNSDFNQNTNGDRKFCSLDCKRFYHNRKRIGIPMDTPVFKEEQRLEFEKAKAEGRRPKTECPVCHSTFIIKRSYWQSYCSKKCRSVARRRREAGVPLDAKSRVQKTPEERFWEKVNKRGSMPGRVSLGRCWNWVAGTDGNGYGNFIESRKNGKISWGGGAHVYSYFLAHGKMPEKGQFVCHECDNRLCVNPNHLFLGSRRDNMKDCSRKGRIINGVIAHKAVKRSNLEHYTEDELKQAVRAIEREIEDRGES